MYSLLSVAAVPPVAPASVRPASATSVANPASARRVRRPRRPESILSPLVEEPTSGALCAPQTIRNTLVKGIQWTRGYMRSIYLADIRGAAFRRPLGSSAASQRLRTVDRESRRGPRL